MKAPVVVSRAAVRDIDGILDYLTREAGHGVATKYRQSLLQLFALLSDQPALGSRRPRLGRGVRVSIVASYLVIYRHFDETTNVLRVLHGRRRINAAMIKRVT